MDEFSALPLSPPAQAPVCLELVGGQRLLVEHGGGEDLLTLVAPGGAVAFSLRVTPAGPVLRFESGLRIEAAGALEFAGQSLSLHGAEQVAITSDGDGVIDVAGNLSTSANMQNIRARRGNVNLKANDDVKATGERIRLNC